MNSDEIRSAFLKFFENKDHKIIPSSSLIPYGDPTLLLTTAGMVQIKPYFLGITVPPKPRLASCQKCFRTTDIDSVGDTKHLTFFEMLGNFSVGDYFKKEAIVWAWEFVTDCLKINKDYLWITVFKNDDESFKLWKDIGVPDYKILRFGEKDNFWGPAGDSGPCGPCSEIHYDFGPNFGCGNSDCSPGCSCGRFLEIWNLVFTEYNQDKTGNRTLLPKPNIDTGMGLERITAVLQNTNSVYNTDLFQPIINSVCQIFGKKYGVKDELDNAIRIIAEHSRGIPFLIADGVLPSNEGRGYVLRRILRRASYFGRRLGIVEPFLSEVATVVIKKMGHIYPELVANERFIGDLVNAEEEKFIATLDTGIGMVERMVKEAAVKNNKLLIGSDIFKLYDTYGFPIELTAEIARKSDISLDLQGFEVEMEKQRERARSKQKFTEVTINGKLNDKEFDDINNIPKTKFCGYDSLQIDAEIVYLMDENTGLPIKKVEENNKVAVILDITPFYGEMGGQVGDTGTLMNESIQIEIQNTILSPFHNLGEGFTIHLGLVKKGSVSIGDKVKAVVDFERRLDIARNHTATHLLQSALRNVLGAHVYQRGSLVAPDRLRFDFSHLKPITKVQIDEIQRSVNQNILCNLPVIRQQMSYKSAIEAGAIAVFEEKYTDTVWVLKIGDSPVSMELCGGTHVKSTGEIGIFLIMSESSIGTGLRRIEAVTGREAERIIVERFNILNKVAEITNSNISDLEIRVQSIINELKSQLENNQRLEKILMKNRVADLIEKSKFDINGVTAICANIPSMPLVKLREMGDMFRDSLGSAVIALGSVYDNKANLVVMVTKDLIKKGIRANDLIKETVPVIGGRGGGNESLAQAGTKDINKISDALEAIKTAIKMVK